MRRIGRLGWIGFAGFAFALFSGSAPCLGELLPKPRIGVSFEDETHHLRNHPEVSRRLEQQFVRFASQAHPCIEWEVARQSKRKNSEVQLILVLVADEEVREIHLVFREHLKEHETVIAGLKAVIFDPFTLCTNVDEIEKRITKTIREYLTEEETVKRIVGHVALADRVTVREDRQRIIVPVHQAVCLLQVESELRLRASEAIANHPKKDCREMILAVREPDAKGPARHLLNTSIKDFPCREGNPWSTNYRNQLEPAGAVVVLLDRHAHCFAFEEGCNYLLDRDLFRSP